MAVVQVVEVTFKEPFESLIEGFKYGGDKGVNDAADSMLSECV